jgi:hypothetical protein
MDRPELDCLRTRVNHNEANALVRFRTITASTLQQSASPRTAFAPVPAIASMMLDANPRFSVGNRRR